MDNLVSVVVPWPRGWGIFVIFTLMIEFDTAKSVSFNLDLSSFEKELVETFKEHQPQPIRAIEKTLKNLLFKEIQRECSAYPNFISASVTIHESYNATNRTLAYLSENGLTLSYTFFETKWKKPLDFRKITCNLKGITLRPFQIGLGEKYYQNDYSYEKKTQINLKTQLNCIELPPSLFFRVLQETKSYQDFFIYTGYEYLKDINYIFELPHYYHNNDNQLFVCSCTKDAFEKTLREYQENPHPKFLEGLCHVCKSAGMDRNSLIDLYGGEFLTKKEPFVKKFVVEGIPHRTAIAEYSRIFKTSKWKNEAELYAIIKVLFPSFTIIREFNPKVLEGLRIDIFIQELNLAIEYQGQQHFMPVKAFGGEDAFKDVQKRDALKKDLCKKNGYELKYFTYKEKISVEYVKLKLKKYLEEDK